MALSSSTLRPGFLVSLKTSVKGNVHYFRKEIGAETQDSGAAIDKWETERKIDDPEEHERAGKTRTKAQGLIRSVCSQSAFGLLCPEVDAEKLEKAVDEARRLVDEFNKTAALTSISIFILTGRVSPDDVEAVRAINSEIRELMAEMSNGIERRNVKDIREAAGRIKGIGEMLATDARTKVQMAVDTARATASKIAKAEKDGNAIEVDKSAIRRLDEMRGSFLDLDEAADMAAPRSASAQLDLGAE